MGLLRAKANPDLQAIDGGTALMSAAGEGHEACVKALLRAKANPELQDLIGGTALHCAELKGHTAIAELLSSITVFASLKGSRPASEPWPPMRKRPELYTTIRSAPPSSSNLAEMPVPAPAPMMGWPEATRARRDSRRGVY